MGVLNCGLLYLRWMAVVSAFITLVAIVWWVGGKQLLRILLPAGVLLIVLIPPPGHDDPVANRLRVVAIHASSRILDFVWVPHLVSGTVIEIWGHRLLVEEACSGINSLLSVIAFSLLYGFWQRRSAGVIVGLTIAAAVFVICQMSFASRSAPCWCITGRSTSSAAPPQRNAGDDAVCGQPGIGDQFPSAHHFILPEKGPVSSRTSSLERSTCGPRIGYDAWRIVSRTVDRWTAAVAFAALGVIMQVRVAHAWTSSRLPDRASFALPEQLAGWERARARAHSRAAPKPMGENPFSGFITMAQSAGVAMDYPFSGFHDSTICYK